MKTFGILGYPLGHSFSREFFSERFKEKNIEAEYLNFEIKDLRDFPALLNRYPTLCGLNVTIPHKQNILPYLDEISDEARNIGAVNCIRIEKRDGKRILTGYNTDVTGFRISLLRFMPALPERALILGNGGAAKAVRYVLQSLHIPTLTVSRTPRTENEITYEELPSYIATHRLIVNTTPLGMWPAMDTYPLLPYDRLGCGHYLFDLVYKPGRTEFMKRGEKYGAHVQNGLVMLLEQALAGWEIWQPGTTENPE